MSIHIVIVGAGQASISCAAKLRSNDSSIKITIIGEEPSRPYQRPPLSKQYSKGLVNAESLQLRPEGWYKKNDVNCETGARVSSIDRSEKRVSLEDGRTIQYDKLILATGSRPRQLPAAVGGLLNGVHILRSLGDADALKSEFNEGKEVLIVGGGYIGLEAAAVFTDLGMKVRLLEAAERILQRVASPQTSDYFRSLHKQRGVEILEGTALECLLGDDDNQVVGALLSNNTELKVDFVLVGIGGIANDALAEAAGLTCNNGVQVDTRGRTNDLDIFACGDCARLQFNREWLRLESVQNAIDQAEIVAGEILGDGTDYLPFPWFWSDQYDVKLQIAGLSMGYDLTVVREGKRPGSRSVWYYRGTQFIAVDAMNDPQAYMVGRKLLDKAISPSRDMVTDTTINVKELLQTVT